MRGEERRAVVLSLEGLLSSFSFYVKAGSRSSLAFEVVMGFKGIPRLDLREGWLPFVAD